MSLGLFTFSKAQSGNPTTCMNEVNLDFKPKAPLDARQNLSAYRRCPIKQTNKKKDPNRELNVDTNLNLSTMPSPLSEKSAGAFSPHNTFGFIFPKTYSADFIIHSFCTLSDPRALEVFNVDKPAQGQTALM